MPLTRNGGAGGELLDQLSVVGEVCIQDDLKIGEGRAVVELDKGKIFLLAHGADPAADVKRVFQGRMVGCF